MSLLPFELVYREHRDELFGFLRRRLPEADAADAFQETCLRALRTYPGLAHGRELRAWLYTIARSVITDRARRASTRPQEVSPHDLASSELAVHTRHGNLTADPAALVADAAGLAGLTDDLPPTERAAVTLRYGLDLSYEQIGAALDASSLAARQATSSGVRRLRRQLDVHNPDTTTERDQT